MVLSLDTTICSPTANSYADLTTAESYFEADSESGGSWAALSQDDRMKLLITASRFIDRPVWIGERLSAARFGAYGLRQALAFPRSNHEYLAGSVTDGDVNVMIDPGLADQASWPDRFFVGGSVLAAGGPNRGTVRRIVGFNSDIGELTVEAFEQPMVAGDGYWLIYPLNEEIVLACLDQAAFLHNGGADGLTELAALGLTGATVDGLSLKLVTGSGPDMSPKAWRRLHSYRASGPGLRRG